MLWPGNSLHDLGYPLILGRSQFANGGYCSVIDGFNIWRSLPQILHKLIHLSIVVQDFWTINNQKQSIGTSSFSIMIFMWYGASLIPMHKKLNKSSIVITLSHVHMLNFYFIWAPAKHFRQYWKHVCIPFNFTSISCFQQCEFTDSTDFCVYHSPCSAVLHWVISACPIIVPSHVPKSKQRMISSRVK